MSQNHKAPRVRLPEKKHLMINDDDYGGDESLNFSVIIC